MSSASHFALAVSAFGTLLLAVFLGVVVIACLRRGHLQNAHRGSMDLASIGGLVCALLGFAGAAAYPTYTPLWHAALIIGFAVAALYVTANTIYVTSRLRRGLQLLTPAQQARQDAWFFAIAVVSSPGVFVGVPQLLKLDGSILGFIAPLYAAITIGVFDLRGPYSFFPILMSIVCAVMGTAVLLLRPDIWWGGALLYAAATLYVWKLTRLRWELNRDPTIFVDSGMTEEKWRANRARVFGPDFD